MTLIDLVIVGIYIVNIINILYLMLKNKRKFFDGFSFVVSMNRKEKISLFLSLIILIALFVRFSRAFLNLLSG